MTEQAAPWYTTETPIVVETTRSKIEWYPKHQKLCLVLKAWITPAGHELYEKRLVMNLGGLRRGMTADNRAVFDRIINEVAEVIRG